MNLEPLQSLPFLTADISGLGGAIKTREDDFLVEELPLYPASGSGTHIYAQIEKKGASTMDALAQIARALGVPRQRIGYAGLKDARAVTRQWISLEHVEPDRFLQLEIPKIKILQLTRHANKIKLGHLAANRFIIRVRNLKVPLPQAAEQARQVMDILTRRGVPNYFGPQRFGNRNDSHLLGQAIVKGRTEEFVDLFLGHPGDLDLSVIMVARTCYEQGLYQKAHDAWPYNFHDQRRALGVLAKTKGDKKKAYNVVDKHLKRFLVSAFQSYLFNRVLAARMPHIDQLLLGDMACKHDNGACFRVEDPALEQPRCDAFAISPTGPLFGYRMTELTGPAGEIENPVLAAEQLQSRDFRQMGYYDARGGRRPLRFQPRHAQVAGGTDDLGPYLQLQFELDPGCYATTVLREITKIPDLA